jgi:CHAT domain-containing protein
VPVTVVPSASVWRILQTRQSAANRLVAFANPNLRGKGTVDLPYADQEVAAIAKLSPAAVVRVYRRDNATKERLFAEAPGASLIHISTHGEFPDEDALDLHGLWLADNGASGAALRAAEVRKLKLQARLVVLSVCNGGLYRIGPSDEPYGLIAAFLEGGAQNVMGTLWQLDDRFGRDFMIEFYKHLKNGPDVAYQAACRRFIGEDDDIRHWAGFVLIGPGRPF